MDILIDRLPRGAGIELVVRGRLDAESSAELRHAVSEAVRQGWHAITLDLSGVMFLSSAGIRVLFETQREARRAGGECVVTVASEPVRKVLELTRLDTILMRHVADPAADAVTTPAAAAPRDIESAGVRLLSVAAPAGDPLHARQIGSAAAMMGGVSLSERLMLRSTSFAIGLAAVGDAGAAEQSAGESLAACGSAFHRPPRPFAVVDYVLGTGDLVPEMDIVIGMAWEGLPRGHSGFEPLGDAAAVSIGDLAAALLAEAPAGPLAVVIIGEVHGLVAAELIRPLAEATADDHPLVGRREVAARWICFSREPVHAGRTAMIVGVICRDTHGPLAGMLAPLGRAGIYGHLHAVVFPHRPLSRSADDLAAVAADLAASEPLAVVHLIADDRPVLGGGVSELVRGSVWFAPLVVPGDAR